MQNNKNEAAKKKRNVSNAKVTTNKSSVKKKTVTNKTNKKKVNSNTAKDITMEKKVSKPVKQEKKAETVSKKKTASVSQNKKRKISELDTTSSKKVKKEKSKPDIKNKKEKLSFKVRISAFFNNMKEKLKTVKEKIIKKPIKKEAKKKPEKKKIEKDPIFTKKTKRIFIIVSVICLAILLLEGISLIIHKINLDNKKVYYDSLNAIAIDGTDIVAAGSSNFKYSKTYSYTEGLEKGKLIKYDKNGKIIFEKMYEKGINTTFSSIINVDDGYVVVGSGVFSEEEKQNEAREAFIIKYDKEGNIVWEKFYQVVTNTRFNKVIETADGYIAVGQSIYANMELGNHTAGGGIIVKYDKEGNEIWRNNHGGMKSGNFNDVVEVNGSFYVVGKDATDSGNIIKYNKDGEYIWHKNYNYTDGIGFTGIAYLNDSLYVVGSKKVLSEDITEEDSRDTTNTDALLVVYDLEGNKKFEKTFGGSNYERYNSILAYHNNLYVAGHISSKDAGFKIETDGEMMTGLVIRYDQDGNILKKAVFGGSNNDNLTDIITDGVSLYISGYSNSDNGNITTAKNNGKDYFGKVIKLDFKFRTLMVK